ALLGAVPGGDGPDARGTGIGVLQGALDRLRGRLTQGMQSRPPGIGAHRVSSPKGPRIWIARREPERPARARWTGTPSAYTAVSSPAIASNLTTSPGRSAST